MERSRCKIVGAAVGRGKLGKKLNGFKKFTRGIGVFGWLILF
jgi:hypothetical protein